MDRLVKDKQRQQEKVQKMREQQEQERMKDSATGQNLFRPKVEGGGLERQGVIWEHLFDIAKSREVRKTQENA